MTTTMEMWCRECNGATKHVTVYRDVVVTREIDGDRLKMRQELLMCTTCWHKESVKNERLA